MIDSQHVSKKEVQALVLPEDVKPTETWTPMSHGQALDYLDAGLKRAGLEVDESKAPRFTLTNEKRRMFAQMTLKQNINDHVALMIGVANSWDRSVSFKIGIGSHVMVCSNGCIFAERKMGRKHTNELFTDLDKRIDEVLNILPTFAQKQRLFFDDLEGIKLSNADAHHFIIEAARAEAITGGEISRVADEWHLEGGRFEEFAPRNAWSLHNSFTEVYKTGAGRGGVAARNGIQFADRSQKLTDTFIKHFELDAHRYSLSQN